MFLKRRKLKLNHTQEKTSKKFNFIYLNKLTQYKLYEKGMLIVKFVNP